MTYQLVFQFQGDWPSDSREALVLEEEMAAVLGEEADMDGHDISDGVTIFFLTQNPQAAFARVNPLLEKKTGMEWLTVAYREQDADGFTVLWPTDRTKPFRLENA